MAINYTNNNQGIGTLDLSEYGLIQPETTNTQVADAYTTPSEGAYGFNLIELDRLKRGGYNPGEVSNWENKEDVQSLIKSLEPTAMAISNYDQLFGPKTMTDANQSLYTGMMDQSGFPVNYTDRIRQQNLPGFAYEPKESLRNIIGSQLQNAKTKAGQGFDFAQQLPGMMMSAVSGIPFVGQIAQGIGGLLSNIFQESPEQKNFRENIATDPEYQNLVNSIPGMSNYNQIFGMGSGRGLMGAIDKRLATLARTEKRQGVNFSDTLKERRKKLEALREIERQKEAAFLESQRRGRRPGTGGGGGVQDSGGSTGGYSYDSGGREGFGYGLKDGGLVSLFTRRG